jgi:cbb3-type cytochrome oxidase subunit 3
MAETESIDDVYKKFFYTSDTPWSVGAHHIIVVAKDPTSLVLSPPSTEVFFEIEDLPEEDVVEPEKETFAEEPLPAPTLFEPVVNNQTAANRPFIVGLSKNNVRIKVFIDDQLDGEFVVNNHESGTANFAYLPSQVLTNGEHLVYTTARDDSGQESILSNAVFYSVSVKQPQIAQAVTEDRQDAVSVIQEKQVKKIDQPVVILEKDGSVAEAKVEVMGTPIEKKIADTGAINENETRQSKLRIDLLAFSLFFIGVLAWLFWVNRELIKEKRAHNQLADLSKDNNNQDKLL